jgi:hypothetical protein
MTTVLEQSKRNVIVVHYNKKHNEDQSIPPWVMKTKGESYYVNHFEVSEGVGFSTKETPNNPHTKGSLKFKGRLKITKDDCNIIGQIY